MPDLAWGLCLHFASFRPHVCKGVEDVRELVGRQVLGLVVSGVDCPSDYSQHSISARGSMYKTCQFTKYATALCSIAAAPSYSW